MSIITAAGSSILFNISFNYGVSQRDLIRHPASCLHICALRTIDKDFVLHTRTRCTRLAARAWATCLSCTVFAVSGTIAWAESTSTASTEWRCHWRYITLNYF
jgi:hypothetical protein